MRTRIIAALILCVFLFQLLQIPIYADKEIYSIQVGVFSNSAGADRFIKQLSSKGIDAFRLSTSINCVFHGIYNSKSEARKDLEAINKTIAGAYVAKFSKRQLKEYEKLAKPIENKNEKTNISSENSDTDGIQPQENKQITIDKTEAGNLKYTYRVMDDISLIGINSESKWYFNLEKSMDVKDFKLNLFCRFNELLLEDNSYISFYINDIPTKSMRLKNTSKALLESWVIDIPVSKVKTGYNELKVKIHSRISEYKCADDKNIANWVVIDKNTNYVITYSEKYTSQDISDFPKPFITKQSDSDKGIGMVIPENYTENEISAALTMIAYMKAYKADYNLKTTLVKADDPSIAYFNSIIYIGSYSNVPDYIRGVIKDNVNLENSNANIYRGSLDNGTKPVMMILSNKGESLIAAVKALKNSDLLLQMKGNYASFPLNFNTAIKDEKIDDYINLNELGLNGIEVKGVNQQTTNIGLRIPYSDILASESNISLKLRYSDNLDYAKSVVSVYINGIPIGSKKLEKDKRDADQITAYIPQALRTKSYYDIKIVFELIPDGIINCERYLTSIPWAYIEGDSYIFAPKKERNIALFENLPYPFSRNDDIDKTIIVLPDKAKAEDLNIAGKISELIGNAVKDNNGIICAKLGNALNDSDYNENLIIFGTPNENSAIKTINEKLWFKFNDSFAAVLSNEKIELLPEFSKTSAFIELKASPYNEEKGIMTITSVNRKSIVNAILYLGDTERQQLTGDAAIISADGDLINFRFQKDEKRPTVKTDLLASKGTRNYIIFAAAIILLMFVGVGFYFYKNRKTNL